MGFDDATLAQTSIKTPTKAIWALGKKNLQFLVEGKAQRTVQSEYLSQTFFTCELLIMTNFG